MPPIRHEIKKRDHWQSLVEQQEFSFHTVLDDNDNTAPYWQEGYCWRFSESEVTTIQKVSEELHRINIDALKYLLFEDKETIKKTGYSSSFIELAKRSWELQEPGAIGRLDLGFRHGAEQFTPVMIEYNAETPVCLLETAIIQKQWLQQVMPDKNQFNSIHQKLLSYWKNILNTSNDGKIFYITYQDDFLEDEENAKYMARVINEAGFKSMLLPIQLVSLAEDQKNQTFLCDPEANPIKFLFKIYPWEWMHRENFFKDFLALPKKPRVFEPPWKALLCNKVMLPLMHKLYPNHPNILKSWFTEDEAKKSGLAYVKKPILSREGAGVTVYSKTGIVEHDGSNDTLERPDVGFIFQERADLLDFTTNETKHHAILGSWIIGNEACGIGIREDKGLVTKSLSCFTPHYFV